MADAMLKCMGDWWLWGSPICKKPELCVAERACYFVAQAAKFPRFGTSSAIKVEVIQIRWQDGVDGFAWAL